METPKRSLDVTNAEHIGYKYGGIEITVLGGIRPNACVGILPFFE